ncbi:ABC transporter permease [Salinigranum rubrum]|uniref:ABC transporter permease n=1 Tax=Salinigranum rubrum TaxID=755307 RepID=A0A2I8VQV7_9EURY|nr:ABC transporter permease subunit [Salinigranum rubrum]AUV83529.1 ABC transporter permease [Salinigranum rubrum]
MFETMRYESRRRVKGTAALTVLLAAFIGLVIYIYPSFAESTAEIDALLESLPQAFREGFGAASYATIEGFLSAEVYQFLWVLLLGLYFTYAGGGLLATDIETGRLYMVLATPVSRTRLALEKFLSLVVPLVTLNTVIPLFVFGASIAIGYVVDPWHLFLVHVLSVPYLLVCSGIGLVLSAVVDRGDVAQRSGIALVFLLFMLDSVTVETDFEWLGTVSPTRYFDPTEILLEETLDLEGTLLLLLVAAVLLVVGLALFQRRDI